MKIERYLWCIVTAIGLLGGYSSLADERHSINTQSLCTPSGYTILFAENHENPTVSVYLGFKGAGYLYEPSDKKGLVSLITELWQAEIDQQIYSSFFSRFYYKGITIKCHGSVLDKENFGIEIQSPSKKLSTALLLVADSLKKIPSHPEHFQQAITRKKQAATENRETPQALATHTLYQLLIGNKGDRPINFSNSFVTLDHITLLDVDSYIAKHFFQSKTRASAPFPNTLSPCLASPKAALCTQPNIIIGAAGGIKAAQLTQHIEAFCKHLLTHSETSREAQSIRTTDNTTSKTQYIYHDIPHSVIHFGQRYTPQSDRYHTQSKYLRLQIEYLLRKRFKDHFGNEYQLSLNGHDADSTVFLGGFSIENTKTQQAIELVQDLFNSIKQNGIPVEELGNQARLTAIKEAHRQTLQQFIEKMQSDNNLAAFHLWNQQTCVLPDLIDLEAQLLQFPAIQQKDIDQLAARLLDTTKLSWVEVGRENHIIKLNS